MFKNKLIKISLFAILLLAGTVVGQTCQSEKPFTFKIKIYKNNQCKGKPADVFLTEPAKSCNTYSYVDSKGVLFSGSHNHFRCYKNKVVFDKYPFSANCLAKESVYEGKEIVEKNHEVLVNKCYEVPSHEGPVYEKIVDYKYPGNEDCKVN